MESFTHSFAPPFQPFCASDCERGGASTRIYLPPVRHQGIAKLPTPSAEDELYLREWTGEPRARAHSAIRLMQNRLKTTLRKECLMRIAVRTEIADSKKIRENQRRIVRSEQTSEMLCEEAVTESEGERIVEKSF